MTAKEAAIWNFPIMASVTVIQGEASERKQSFKLALLMTSLFYFYLPGLDFTLFRYQCITQNQKIALSLVNVKIYGKS
jgi:hypothetical protein